MLCHDFLLNRSYLHMLLGWENNEFGLILIQFQRIPGNVWNYNFRVCRTDQFFQQLNWCLNDYIYIYSLWNQLPTVRNVNQLAVNISISEPTGSQHQKSELAVSVQVQTKDSLISESIWQFDLVTVALCTPLII